jgi:cobalt ECF transporter T component CbiQ
MAPQRSPLSPRLRSTFVERTLAGLDRTFAETLSGEALAHRPGFLQSLDPRTKLVCVLLVLLTVSLSQNLVVIAAWYALALGLAALSAVPLGFFVRRVWLLLPFFTGLVALPALFLVPGPVLVALPLGLAITRTGALAALFLVLRVGTSVSWVALLVLTTPWNALLRSLAALKIPDVMVLVLGMTYRYIYLLIQIAGEMLVSRKSRMVGRLDAPAERRLLAASLGALLTHSLDLSGEVYLAMQSRGFRGVPRTLGRFHLRPRDWLCLAGTIAIIGVNLWFWR